MRFLFTLRRLVLRKTYSGSRIQGSKRHRIQDPGPQHCHKDFCSPWSAWWWERIPCCRVRRRCPQPSRSPARCTLHRKATIQYKNKLIKDHREQKNMIYSSVFRIRIHLIRIHKGRPSYIRNPSAITRKRKHPALQIGISYFFSILLVIFAFAFINPLYLAQNNNHLVQKID